MKLPAQVAREEKIEIDDLIEKGAKFSCDIDGKLLVAQLDGVNYYFGVVVESVLDHLEKKGISVQSPVNINYPYIG